MTDVKLAYQPTSSGRCSCGKFWDDHTKAKTAIRYHNSLCGGIIILDKEENHRWAAGKLDAMRKREAKEWATAQKLSRETFEGLTLEEDTLKCLSRICETPRFNCPFRTENGISEINPKAWKILGDLKIEQKGKNDAQAEVRAEKKRAKNRERAKKRKNNGKKKKEQQLLAEAVEVEVYPPMYRWATTITTTTTTTTTTEE